MGRVANVEIVMEDGNKKTVRIRELRVKDIINISQEISEIGREDVTGFRTFFERWLPACVNLTMEEVLNLSPSDIEKLWDKFKEVNQSFLQMLKKMGLEEIWQGVIKGIQEDLKKSFLT